MGFEAGFLPSALVVEAQSSSIFVGLTLMSPEALKKTQPESGNIIKYVFDGVELTRETQCESFGSVMDLAIGGGAGVLFAGINSKLVAFDFSLTRLHEVQGQILVYKVKAAGKDSVIVTDAMKSLTVYSYNGGG